ncbi:MAG: hypothetical protein IJW54_06400 [Clostridia bacterium]|nr:hypothetical protein [Clostridia bacterium]
MSNQSFDEMLNNITSNEELMSKISEIVKNNKNGEISDTLPSVLSLIASNGQKNKEEKNDEIREGADTAQTNSEQEKNNSLNNDFTSLIGSLGKQLSSSSQLLLAIKPYLNKNRQSMVDTMVKLSSLANVINLGR